jgi:hypothetical protein
MNSNEELRARVATLEIQARVARIGFVVVVGLMVGILWMPHSSAQSSTDPLRVRGLIVEDDAGRARIFLGPTAASSAKGIGLRINDINGFERFGLSLKESGSMGMGFDAPPGTGDPRNSERINIVADEKGGAVFRFLDRRTSVAARMSLDDQNHVSLELADN